jgi:hypothetical protein
MARIYDVEVRDDIEIEVDEFWDACDSREKDALRDLVFDEYNLNPADSRDAAVFSFEGSLADGSEAKEYIRKVCADLEWRLKMRDFS